MRLQTTQGVYLLKWNPDPLPGMFGCEAEGLRLLKATATIRVPEPYSASDATAQHPAFILMEFLEDPGGTRKVNDELLGRQLADLHRTGQPPGENPVYGLNQDNYIGPTVQPNGWDEDWIAFFREKRLRFQGQLAQRNGRLTGERRRRLDMILDHMEDYLGGVRRQPALIHGDLWGGNVMIGPGGAPALIDPAVYYADREAEIAYTQLFGGFSRRFYTAYEEVWPLEAGYGERRDLYNLYHLLNHLNIFGESYGGQVDSVLRRYARN
jgi:fructosamine-3-kinase